MLPHDLEFPDSYGYIPEAYQMWTIHKSDKDLGEEQFVLKMACLKKKVFFCLIL